MTQPSVTYFTLGKVGSQAVQVSFDGGRIVSEVGLLAVRALEKPLRVIAHLAARLPDPRSPKSIHHSAEALLTQAASQILAGYPDFNEAQARRDDPLFQILADISPDAEHPLASDSTLSRFRYAFTRRQAELPVEERPVLLEVRAAQTGRLKIRNDYLVESFGRTRRTPPTEIILDVAATDDPVPGHQTLSGYHGYYRRHQYLPLLVYDGVTGFPLAAWLRPGAIHAGLGVVEVLDRIIRPVRAVWPLVRIRGRSDNGHAVPELYNYCAGHDLPDAFGYASKAVRQRAPAAALADLELDYAFYGHREPSLQRLETLTDYQAESWPQPRRSVAKLEITPQGRQRRFVVTDLTEPAAAVYRDFDGQRGRVPEQPIGAVKNGLQADRLSAGGFCANAFRLLVHTLAYALVVRFREAGAAVPEVAPASVATLRQRLWEVGAVLVSSARRLWLRVSETWPGAERWGRVLSGVRTFVAQLGAAVPAPAGGLPMEAERARARSPGAADEEDARRGREKGRRQAGATARDGGTGPDRGPSSGEAVLLTIKTV